MKFTSLSAAGATIALAACFVLGIGIAANAIDVPLDEIGVEDLAEIHGWRVVPRQPRRPGPEGSGRHRTDHPRQEPAPLRVVRRA